MNTKVPEGSIGTCFITTDQVAAWAGISEDEVRRMANADELTAYVLGPRGRRFRFKEREVAARFGLEVPGPREREIARERAEAAMAPPVARQIPPTFWGEWVYKLFDAEGMLLYVGITRQGVRRLEDHDRTKHWFRRVVRVDIEHFDTREECEVRERELIRTAAPLFNVTHRRQSERPKNAPGGER